MHPSNPVLAFGPRANWIVEGHENCRHPCGLRTPFEKVAQLKAKVLFLDASMLAMTFFHYLEDMLEERLPFALFREELMEASVIDYSGTLRTVRTYAYSDEAISRRRPGIMHDELERRLLIARARVGNSRLILLATDDVVRVVMEMAAKGVFFYA
jgi:aminoglycoside 3-N-acetyltransferase